MGIGSVATTPPAPVGRLGVDDAAHPLGAQIIRPPFCIDVRPPQFLDGRLDGEPLRAEFLEACPQPNVPERCVQHLCDPLICQRPA